MSDLSDLSDLSDICAAKISRAGKNKRSQYPWVNQRGALQYRQGMTAFPPPPAGQGGVMVLPATDRRPRELSGMTGYTAHAVYPLWYDSRLGAAV